MEFYINNQKIDVKIEDEQTIGDVLKSFELTCEENNAAVIGIMINNQQITAENFDEESAKPLSEDIKFEFTIVTVNDIKASFEKLSTLFDELSKEMSEVPVALQNGKNIEVSNSIKNLADSIDQFCHVATLASLFPNEFASSNVNSVNFNNFFEEFSPILKDFEDALKNNDSVMIGDLSEYEICPRLQSISAELKKI